jgi:hypothetical protein
MAFVVALSNPTNQLSALGHVLIFGFSHSLVLFTVTITKDEKPQAAFQQAGSRLVLRKPPVAYRYWHYWAFPRGKAGFESLETILVLKGNFP